MTDNDVKMPDVTNEYPATPIRTVERTSAT